MDKKELEIIVGINRIFEIENIMHQQYKNINLIYQERKNTNTIDLELIQTRNTFYNVFCCATYDVIDAIIKKFSKYKEVEKLCEYVNKSFILGADDKLIINLQKDKYTLLEMLNAYRVFYTHPDMNYLETRVDKKTLFEMNIDDNIMEDIHSQINECVKEINENCDLIELNDVEFNQNKRLILRLIKSDEKIIAKIKKNKINLNNGKWNIKIDTKKQML